VEVRRQHLPEEQFINFQSGAGEEGGAGEMMRQAGNREALDGGQGNWFSFLAAKEAQVTSWRLASMRTAIGSGWQGNWAARISRVDTALRVHPRAQAKPWAVARLRRRPVKCPGAWLTAMADTSSRRRPAAVSNDSTPGRRCC
jgi:hypothetical protein